MAYSKRERSDIRRHRRWGVGVGTAIGAGAGVLAGSVIPGVRRIGPRIGMAIGAALGAARGYNTGGKSGRRYVQGSRKLDRILAQPDDTLLRVSGGKIDRVRVRGLP
jgi:hypothetical protein